ncbi:MAG: hypothetical protein WAX77_04595 [Methylococcaceae bacterium]
MNINQLYNFLMVIAGLIAVYSILVFMPMFFTYLSEGDTRAPSGGTATAGQSVSQLHAKKYAAP